MRIISSILLVFTTMWVFAQSNQVQLFSDDKGTKLNVDGKDIIINGMNWDYFPIGTNYNYSLWNQSDKTIKAALDEEMALLKNMNVNAIRVYSGIPARWITYIYNNYGIYTMLNHSFGRYGLDINGVWTPTTNYADKSTQEVLLAEVEDLVKTYNNTPGLLLYLLGNENNYGLFWQGAETEAFPDEDEKRAFVGESRGRPMYKLMNEAAKLIKQSDNSHPVALCNGDALFIDIIADECKDVDIFGVNAYRGVSFTDMFDTVKEKLDMPILFTEFGSDAFNARTKKEAQEAQAEYLIGNWEEIYKNAYGQGKAGNSIGGFTFQFSDGWWKFKQTEDLDVHNDNASWPNGGYQFDYKEGENNMNEEWFGICAKGETDENGLYQLYPRAAYYVLKEVHSFNPLQANTKSLNSHFDQLQITDAKLRARGDKAALEGNQSKLLNVNLLRAEFTTFNTGGSLIETPEDASEDYNKYPNKLGFDHMQSFYVGVQAQPTSNMRANVSFNILGNVAENPINEIFYENRGRPIEVVTPDGNVNLQDVNRFQVYQADYEWNNEYFDLTGFYRTGHYHWGYEGDFFGFYPEANYGPNLDMYGGMAPIGMEFDSKKILPGLKLAIGPELWWGANPAILGKYTHSFNNLELTGMFQEDLEQRSSTETSFVIPQPKTRKASLAATQKLGKLELSLGGIWAGQPLEGREYQVVRGEGATQQVYVNTISSNDTWGGKAKLTYEGGKFNWYAQGAAMGLVANGGADLTQTFTGWRLKDSGSGNQYNFLSGFTYSVGDLQIAPNFLWQKPIEDPIPSDVMAPGRPRNILQDPFIVRANREQVAGEILFTYDPTPATWFYQWDNDRAEDAQFAMNLGFVYRHLPTIQDAAIGILPDGRSTFAFPGSAPAKDLWEAHARIVSKINPDLGIIANLYGGDAQANGDDERTIHRFGADIRTIYKKLKLGYGLKFNDWGPYDYHRDYNLTYPFQMVFDISTTLGKPQWFALPNTQFGVMATYRTLDQYSNRYCPNRTFNVDGSSQCNPDTIGFGNGTEWEIRTYLHINIGK